MGATGGCDPLGDGQVVSIMVVENLDPGSAHISEGETEVTEYPATSYRAAVRRPLDRD